MSAATSAVSTALGSAAKRAIGDVNMEIHTIGFVSGDTTATATATALSRIDLAILVAAVVQSAVPTISGTTATFTVTDPAATVKGHVILLGR